MRQRRRKRVFPATGPEGVQPDTVSEVESRIARDTAQLQEREAHYRLLFEAETDAILLIDNKTGRVLEANPAASGLYGYTHDELLALRNVDLSADPRQTRRVTTRTPVDYDKRVFIPLRYHRKKDGTVFVVEIAGRFFVRDGRPVHLVAIRDITERVKTDQFLRQSREELRAIYDSVPLLMCTIDRSRRILFANRAFIAFCRLDERAVLKGQACGVLGCLNAREDRRGCGFGKRCRSCRILLAIKDTFRTGREHYEEPYRATVERNGEKRDVVMLGSTALIRAGDQPKVLLCLEDVTARSHTAKELEQSRGALRALLARMERDREDVRRSIAREIHDELGQNLTGIKMDLRWCERNLFAPVPQTGALRRRIGEAIGLVDRTTGAVQKLAAALRPCVLDSLGIAAALQYEVQQFRARTGIRCEIRVPRCVPPTHPDTVSAVFRILQECLTNVVRHAEATHVSVALAFRDAQMILRVKDDGIGISEAALASPQSLGLLGMRERAGILGGGVSITRGNPTGTWITVRVPADGGGRVH